MQWGTNSEQPREQAQWVQEYISVPTELGRARTPQLSMRCFAPTRENMWLVIGLTINSRPRYFVAIQARGSRVSSYQSSPGTRRQDSHKPLCSALHCYRETVLFHGLNIHEILQIPENPSNRKTKCDYVGTNCQRLCHFFPSVNTHTCIDNIGKNSTRTATSEPRYS